MLRQTVDNQEQEDDFSFSSARADNGLKARPSFITSKQLSQMIMVSNLVPSPLTPSPTRRQLASCNPLLFAPPSPSLQWEKSRNNCPTMAIQCAQTQTVLARTRCMENPFTPHKTRSRGKCWGQKVGLGQLWLLCWLTNYNWFFLAILVKEFYNVILDYGYME